MPSGGSGKNALKSSHRRADLHLVTVIIPTDGRALLLYSLRNRALSSGTLCCAEMSTLQRSAMYAHATLDASALAIRKIHLAEKTNRFEPAKVSLLKAFSPKVPTIVGRWLGGIVASRVRTKAETCAERAFFFRGIAFDLYSRLQEGNASDQEELASTIDPYVASLLEGELACKQVIVMFRRRNSQSQVAGAFEEMISALASLRESVLILRTVARGGSIPGLVFPVGNADSWETAVERQREVFSDIRSMVRSRDDGDIDPELLALAEAAISASDSRDLATDEEWAKRLSSGPLH